jgi:hypothetical protein
MKRRLLAAALLLGTATVVVRSWPDLARYAKIRRM